MLLMCVNAMRLRTSRVTLHNAQHKTWAALYVLDYNKRRLYTKYYTVLHESPASKLFFYYIHRT